MVAWDMRCGRCGEDIPVRRYDVDGFTGHLCGECREAWEALQQETIVA